MFEGKPTSEYITVYKLSIPLNWHHWRQVFANIMASQPTPPNVPPLRNKGLMRPYWGKLMVNKALNEAGYFPGRVC